jgi:hypothetical protein
MMKVITNIFIICLLLFSFCNISSAIPVVGGQGDSTPNGCAGLTLDITDNGTFNTFNTLLGSTGNTFAINTYERVAWGFTNTVGQGLVLAYLSLNPASLISQTFLNVNNNDPDAENSYSGIFNPVTGQFIGITSQVVSPCAVTACLHIRTFDGSTVNQNITISSVRHDASPNIAHAVDSQSIFIQVINSTTNQATLRKYSNPGLVFDTSVDLDVSGGTVNQWTDDGANLYGPKTGTSVIYRINKSTMVLTSFTISGVVLLQSGITNDGDFLYVFGGVSGTAHLYKISLQSMTLSGTINLGAVETGTSQSLFFDPFVRKIYLLSNTGAGGWIFRRFDRSPFAISESVTNTDGGRSGWVGGTDYLNKKFWFQDVDSSSHLHELGLCG